MSQTGVELWAHADNLEKLNAAECNPDVWWSIAYHYPWEAINSPLYGVYTLENPERWLAFYRPAVISGWVDGYAQLQYLPAFMLRQFAADCVEQTLCIFDRATPNDKRPHRLVELLRKHSCRPEALRSVSPRSSTLYIRDGREAVPEDLRRAARELREEWYKMCKGTPHPEALEAILFALDVPIHAPALARSAISMWHGSKIGVQLEIPLWQWNRLLHYLQLEKERIEHAT